MKKQLFSGTFNYSGHIFKLHTQATSPQKAFLNFVNQIAKSLNVGKRTVMFKFSGQIDNYEIKEVLR